MKGEASGAEILNSLHVSGLSVSSELPEVAGPANCAHPNCHGEKPHPSDPNYIHACYHQKWKLATWEKTNPESINWRPARCFSWRHAGPCQRAKASEDYSRIKEALAKHDRSSICYGVLTLDPSAWSARGWEPPPEDPGAGKRKRKARPRKAGAVEDDGAIQASYKALSERWRLLAQAIRRQWGAFDYVSTVEAHRSGWPHLNVVFVCPELAQDVDLVGNKLRAWGRKSKGREVARRVFDGMLERCGFGPIAFLERALPLIDGDEDRLAAYIAKLSGDAGSIWDGKIRGLREAADDAPEGAVVHSIEGHTVGEISKLSQVPLRAPDHFRRLRSSKGFLPAKKRDPNITGEVYDENGLPLGSDSSDALLRIVMQSNTPESLRMCEEKLSELIDKHQKKRATLNIDGEEIEVQPRQSRIVKKLADVNMVLEAKIRGEWVEPPPSMGRRIFISGIDGMTIDSRESILKFFGDSVSGPGMNNQARKYVIGNRYYSPPSGT